MRSMRHRALALLAPLAFAGCGGENVISGFGNSSNIIGADVLERVAKELAGAPAVPAVTDDDLRAAFSAIHTNALAGDPDAALVLLRVAAYQKEQAE